MNQSYVLGVLSFENIDSKYAFEWWLEQGQCGEVRTEMIKVRVLVASVVFEATGSDVIISGVSVHRYLGP